MEEMAGYSSKIITIPCHTTIKAAAQKILDEDTGCLIINDLNGKFIGIVTKRDIVACAISSAANIETTAVTEIMTPHIVSCPVGTPVNEARGIMDTNHIPYLPVVKNRRVVGILSATDLMGQQRLEDRTAAEEVAMLSNCLKSTDFREAVETVTQEVPKLFQAMRCVLCLWDSSKDSGNPSAEPHITNDDPPAIVSHNKCLCARKYLPRPSQHNECKFYYKSNPDHCLSHGAEMPRLIVPLSISGLKDNPRNELLGYLCMCGLMDAGASNRDLVSYKAKLTQQILNSHLTNARLYYQARLSSLTDVLTGVGSRRLLEDKLDAECARAKRYKRPFSVAIIDLDNFKSINDIFGHATGDDALKTLTGCMKSQKRKPDILARYGGDEFVILMPETKAEEAVALLERIRTGIEHIKVADNVSMTISCGIAQNRPDKDNAPSEVIRRADLALYEAKSAGRNCVKLWHKSMSKVLKDGDIEVEKIKRLKRRIAGLSEQAEQMFMQSIWGLVQALEAKSPYAKKHSENVMYYVTGIAQTMNISPRQIEILRRAAMIHDIGKIGVPDAILCKPGKLTPHERAIIEQHPLIGVRILEKMSFLEDEITIVRSHHEKWNGQGYPDGLSNTAIPFGARLMAVADSFDALTATRPYHHSRSLDEAIGILTDSSGYDFDPEIVKAMVSWTEEIRNRLGEKRQLTPKDLLDSQKCSDDQSTSEPVVAACSTCD
ncbi:MAG: diguanylate cyclase [Sedimentisphaerales bacterium]|nr:diguanylate cyclase [Sedimentisphaerales bacterium]